MPLSWNQVRRTLAAERLPCALVDLDAFEANADWLAGVAARGHKRLRIATKSLRCPDLVARAQARHPDVLRGVMTYSAPETAFLAARGERDLLCAYPTARAGDAADLAAACAGGAAAAVVVDAAEQLDVLARAATERQTSIPVVLEVDMAYRPLRGVHLGVRRSPLRAAADVVALAERVRATAGLTFHGIMGYEAQVAGLPDQSPFAPLMALPARALKRLSRPRVEHARADVVAALAARGLPPRVVNGGGTGSLSWSAAEPALTEVTAGSGYLCGHLFDYYRDLDLQPALYFALQVVRRPGPGLVTCHGGGYVASGEAGADRLPLPALPRGLRLLSREGAGEVQTPLRVPDGALLGLGDPVLFRPAKSGELAEHFAEYLLVRGDTIEARVPTYRGLGQCFLG